MKNIGMVKNISLVILGVFSLILLSQHTGYCQGWPDIKVRLLPDSSFALIEKDSGEKIRHCPYRDINGKIDKEQLIYVLGTIHRETWLNPKNKKMAVKNLEIHYNMLNSKIMKKGMPKIININKANLVDLVALPQIGPVMAVKIIEYRNIHHLFLNIEEIKKIEGIGQGTFNSICHYIRTD